MQLDDDLTAVVADLGLSRFQQDDGKMSTAGEKSQYISDDVIIRHHRTNATTFESILTLMKSS